MQRLVILGIIFIWQMLAHSSACAWNLPIEVSTVTKDGEKVYNKLVVGMETDATDGFDNLWDTPALVSHPDTDKPILLRAYIIPGASAGEVGEEEMSKLWKDIRGAAAKGDVIWDIIVDSVPTGKSVVISWQVPQGFLKAGERLVLRDNGSPGPDGQPVQTDITRSEKYVFISDSVEPRPVSLVLSKNSANKSSSGSGSGFGCGTVKLQGDGPAGGRKEFLNMVILFLPIVVVRLLRRRGISRLFPDRGECASGG